MTQPDYVPLRASDRVRPSDRLTLPGVWRQDRPGEQVTLQPPSGARFGATGPDMGYGLKLAKRLEPRLELREGESMHDVIAAGFACGSRRAASLGRAPVIYDFEWAFTLWGYLGGASQDLIDARVELIRGAGHDYAHERAVADAVAEPTLRLNAGQVREQLASWRQLIHLG